MDHRTRNLFQMVILQCARIVIGTKNIYARIVTQLALWNNSVLDELVTDPHATNTSYLTRVCVN